MQRGEQPKEQDFLGFLADWFTGYIDDRRQNPRDDVLTQMANATFPDGSMPEVVDVVRVATLLFAGGQGTAARFLGNAMKYLAEQPEVQHRLREDPAQVPQFLEEMLRFNSPVKVNFRMARTDTTLAGVDVPAGSTVVMLLAAADRDAARFGCPADFDLGRGNAPVSTSPSAGGCNSCPGGPLVRTEGRITPRLGCSPDLTTFGSPSRTTERPASAASTTRRVSSCGNPPNAAPRVRICRVRLPRAMHERLSDLR